MERKSRSRIPVTRAEPAPAVGRGDDRTASAEAKFEEFYKGEFKRAVSVVRRAGASQPEAEDAVSDAMIKAWPRFESLENPQGWVHVVALRHYIRSARRDRQRSTREPLATVPAAPLSPEDGAFLNEVQQAVRALPRRQRMVLALVLADHTTADIAEILKIKEGTVRSHLRHAREELVRLLRRGSSDD